MIFMPLSCGELAHGLLVVLDERLLEQHALGEEVAQPAFDHLGDDVLRLAFLAGRLGEDLTLLVDRGRIEVFLGQRPAGFMAAMCMPTSLAASGVPPLTSTSTPTVLPS